MTVIAFRPRPRPAHVEQDPGEAQGAVFHGTFRTPRGRLSTMDGTLRLHRILIVPRGVFVSGAFSGVLREPDGSLIGADSRRATVRADLQRDDQGLRPVVRALHLDLMGLSVNVRPFEVDPVIAFPNGPEQARRGLHRPREPWGNGAPR